MPRDAVMTNIVKSFKFTFSRTISWCFWDMANQHDYSRKERKRVGKKRGKRYRRAENGKRCTHMHTHKTISHYIHLTCSHEIKRRLLLGRKVMTNLDSIFKSRDVTLPTKVHLVEAMVFPVVMYGCESWTMKKAERRRIDAFEL